MISSAVRTPDVDRSTYRTVRVDRGSTKAAGSDNLGTRLLSQVGQKDSPACASIDLIVRQRDVGELIARCDYELQNAQ